MKAWRSPSGSCERTREGRAPATCPTCPALARGRGGERRAAGGWLTTEAFWNALPRIDSAKHKLDSGAVLAQVGPFLAEAGFRTETGKSRAARILMPVLFGPDGERAKTFEADAFHPGEHFVLEVEAGRGVTNYQFLKDLFEACMMQDVRYLAIAVRRDYRGSPDFDRVCTFFDTLYASRRLPLPLDGVLIVGY